MREKKRILLIMLCLCIVLGGAAALLLRPKDSGNDKFTESPAEHEHPVDEGFIENTSGDLLIDKESSDVDSIVLTNNNGKFTILRDKTTSNLYIKEIDRNVPLCNDFIEYVWYYAYCLGYNYKIISTSDSPIVPSDYGLDSPSARFEISYKDGSNVNFDIGSSIVTSENIYYLTFNGDEKSVYITEISLAVFEGEGYFIDTDFFSKTDENVESVEIGTIKLSGTSIPKKIVIEPYSSDDRSDQSYGHSHIITAPVKTAVNDVNATALANELIYLSAESALCSAPSKSTLSEYGLDDPSLIVTFVRNGKEQTLYIGKTDKSTYCYAKLKGIDVIYNIDPLQAETLLSSSLSFYRSGELRLFRINAVESVTVEFSGEKYSFDINRTALSGDDEYYEYHIFNGNKELSLDNYRNFLSVLSSAYTASWETKASSKTPSLTVTVSYFDSYNRPDDTLKFYEADFNRFVCSINGTDTASVSAIYLTRVMEASRLLASGSEVKS